jgi:hypothetical protein
MEKFRNFRDNLNLRVLKGQGECILFFFQHNSTLQWLPNLPPLRSFLPPLLPHLALDISYTMTRNDAPIPITKSSSVKLLPEPSLYVLLLTPFQMSQDATVKKLRKPRKKQKKNN